MSELKTPDDKEIGELVTNIYEWLSKQPHLPLIENKLITKFLINCKFRLQETKTKIENYYSSRTNLPSVFQNRDPTAPEIRKSAKAYAVFPLSQCSKDGDTIIIIKSNDDPDDFVAEDWVKRAFMMLDVIFSEANGGQEYIAVVDWRGYTMQHFFKFATSAKLFFDILQNVIPARFKGVHFINAPSFTDKIVEFFRMFLKPKLRERAVVHQNMETFYDVIGDRDILPSDLGGKEPPIVELNDEYQRKLESLKNWFEKEERLQADEKLRPRNTGRRPSWPTWLTGTEGSFKNLTVD